MIDTHCHSFPPVGSPPGWDPAVNNRLLQYHEHGSRLFWRMSDGVGVEEGLLDFPSDNIDDMPDVGFHVTDGKGVFTVDGTEYYLLVCSPSLKDSGFPAERMVGEMDIAGVDVAVIQSDHGYGALNEYYSEVTRSFPDRFIALAQVLEWEAYCDSQLELLERAVLEQGCKGLYFSVEAFALAGYVHHLEDKEFRPLWDLVRRLEVPIWWHLYSPKHDRRGAFMERVAELTRWTDENPNIPNLLTHNLVPEQIIQELGVPDEIIKLVKSPNTYAEFLNPAKGPYPKGPELIRRMCGEAGAGTFTWGSDMPSGSGHWITYKQAVDQFAVHCDFLTPDERAMILGGNAERIFTLAPPA